MDSRRIITHLRDRVLADALYDDGLELFSGLISEEELTLLQKIIVDGTSYADAAGELGISIWACRKRVQRAIDKLHKRCREKFGENFP